MKKRIFIAIHYLEIGGAEISLIGLLQSIDYTKYEVDLFVYRHQGELMKFIPKEVNLLPEIGAYSHVESPLKDAVLHGYWGIAAGRLWAKLQHKVYVLRRHPKDGSAIFQYVFRNTVPFLPSLKKRGSYDCAVSFLTPHNIVAEKVEAKRKIAWIHTDYSKIDVNAELEYPVWNSYDKIVSISPAVTKSFLDVFPRLSGKIVEIENILSASFVRGRAELVPSAEIRKFMPKEEGLVNLLSVGRFSEAKNYDNVPNICRRIMDKGCRIRWYIIGYGGDEALIRRQIRQEGVENDVVILGKKENPYPYIKSCDFYVQPSRYEGKSVTVREAQMLCRPVIVTNYTTAKSQVQDGKDGVIVPMDNEGCAEGIAAFIKDKGRQAEIEEYLSAHDYGNEREIHKVYNLID